MSFNEASLLSLPNLSQTCNLPIPSYCFNSYLPNQTSSFPKYYSIAYLQNRFLQCLLLFDLNLNQPICFKPAYKPKQEIFDILEDLSQRKEPIILILFDNLLEIDLNFCHILTRFNFQFVIFSESRNESKFEKHGWSLSRENEFMYNKKGLYIDYFDRIEILSLNQKFESFHILVERLKFEHCLSCEDKDQLQYRYMEMRKFLTDSEEVTRVLNDHKECTREKNKLIQYSVEECFKIFEDYFIFKCKKSVNYSFEYYFDNYFLHMKN